MSINRFGEIGIEFAKLGLQHKLSPETREAIINLLDALRFYFHEIQEVNRHELDALRTLLLYEPSSANYRAEYVAVLYESEQLQVHELRACRSGGRMDWFAFAQKVTHHLSVLVNTTRLSQVIEMELKHSGTAHEDFLRRMEQRAEALRRAQAIYKSGDYEGCLRLVHPVLPPEITPWVFLEDLQALDLWLRCASNSSLSQTADVNRRAKQLRNATLKYISQFKLTIEEKDIQILATKLLNALDAI